MMKIYITCMEIITYIFPKFISKSGITETVSEIKEYAYLQYLFRSGHIYPVGKVLFPAGNRLAPERISSHFLAKAKFESCLVQHIINFFPKRDKICICFFKLFAFTILENDSIILVR